ncbi:MAG TPA: cupredoxin domain-containing protein, partial [Actinomycetota bacterium]|nr:cupredoxin domain-containing protein [Actinomycetota bacterium]
LALAPPVVATEEPGSEQGATGRVRIVDNRFRPRSVTVERGTRVRWSNAGRNAHTVTADNGSFDSGPLAPGDRFRRRFRRVGTFTYHCTIHPRMSGTIQVV